jgi:hypothetical protein
VADKKSERGKAKKPRAAAAKSARSQKDSIVESTAPAPAGDAEAAPAPEAAPTSATPQQGGRSASEQQQQSTISTSRGFVDFLATNRLSIALTSYQTGQLMLIGPLLDSRLSVFQRNFVRAMGLVATPQRLYLSAIAQIWRLETCSGQAGSPTSSPCITSGSMCRACRTPRATSMPMNSRSTAKTSLSSSTPNIPALPRSMWCTASSRYGNRLSSQNSRQRIAAI